MSGREVEVERLAAIGTAHLQRVIAIDSQSDEDSETIPSTEGQRVLSGTLKSWFEGLGLEASQDKSANLIVRIPARGEGAQAPSLALMVHMDTAKGTDAVPHLEHVPAWDGGLVVYPESDRLHVSVADYPELEDFKGEDLLHGPGRAPIGLDDKLGMAQLMTLAQVLTEEPARPCPELFLVFRPDEEIGRMAAVEELATALAQRGVRYGYTVDGIEPFEVNTENFNAARACLTFQGRPATWSGGPGARRLDLRISGVKSHGATAQAEGYRNATLLLTQALTRTGFRSGILPVSFRTDPLAEVDAEVSIVVSDDEAREALLGALQAEIAPHARRGARLEILSEGEPPGRAGDALLRAARHLARFLSESKATPLLSEDSEGYGGYSNPYSLVGNGAGCTLDYRLRDFDPAKLVERAEEVRALAADAGAAVEVSDQYTNMGPSLAAHPELVTWACAAGLSAGVRTRRRPIRGGTGVDPFLAAGIPVANLGTGYFAPESEKELTSRQTLGRHALWLLELAGTVASQRART